MPYQLGANIGFVTNSSSVVYHFPKKLLEYPAVKAFLAAYEIEDGFVGDDLWHRGECGTIALDRKTKELADQRLHRESYGAEGGYAPGIAVDDDNTFVVVIGDEHHDLAYIFSHMLCDLAREEGLGDYTGQDYN